MFDKKNTMILTIVAVATLLVAVVGATFAYFSTGISGGATTTTATVTTATPGSIVIDGVGKTLTLRLSPADMMAANIGKYYALDKDTPTAESNHGDKNAKQSYTIATAKINDGGSSVTYSCGYSVTVKPKEAFSDFTGLYLELDGPGIGGADVNTKVVELTSLTTAGQTLNGTFNLTGPTGSSEIKAGLYLENKNDNGAQNTIANKNIELTIDVAGKNCNILAN